MAYFNSNDSSLGWAWDVIKTLCAVAGVIVTTAYGFLFKRIESVQRNVDALAKHVDESAAVRDAAWRADLEAYKATTSHFREELLRSVATKGDLADVRTDIRDIRSLIEQRILRNHA